MAGETVITIVGNLTADPELRTTQNGGTVCNFIIASTPRQYNSQSGQWEDGPALFLRCAAWRDLAAHCAQSLSKGMRVIAQGRLRQHSYQAQDGSNRIVIEMQVDEIGPSLRYATAQVTRADGNWPRDRPTVHGPTPPRPTRGPPTVPPVVARQRRTRGRTRTVNSDDRTNRTT